MCFLLVVHTSSLTYTYTDLIDATSANDLWNVFTLRPLFSLRSRRLVGNFCFFHSRLHNKQNMFACVMQKSRKIRGAQGRFNGFHIINTHRVDGFNFKQCFRGGLVSRITVPGETYNRRLLQNIFHSKRKSCQSFNKTYKKNQKTLPYIFVDIRTRNRCRKQKENISVLIKLNGAWIKTE